MEDPDPSLQFFPEGQEVDLYGVLDVKEDAAEADIRKAYRRLALRYHPDKVLSRSAAAPGGTVDEDAHTRFQQIGFAYAVLSDEGRRKRYDATGRTDELKFGMGDSAEGVDWNAYFATLWTGNVSGSTLDDFKKKYQQSKEEREEILAAYEETQGSLAGILSHVPCLDVLADEERVIGIVNAAIKAKDIEELPKWRAELDDTKGREGLRKEAKKEASEAEAYAKELGVWDELFGKSGTKGARRQGKKMKGEAEHDGADDDEDEEEEDEEDEEKPRKGKAKAKGPKAKAEPKAKSASSSKKPAAKGKKGKAAADDDEIDEDGEDRLAALFAKRAKERQGGFNGLVERLEAQAREEEAAAAAKKGSKAKAPSAKAPKGKASTSKASSKPAARRRSPPAPGMEPDPLDDDEFAKIQASMMKRAEAGKKAAGSKRKADEEAAEEEERKSALKALADGRKKKKQKA